MMGVIIDISHHQPPSSINYDKLAKQVDLVIIRTQYGSNTLDNHYKTHHKEFQKRGVPTAAYAWIRGASVADMEKEATDFYNRTKEFNPCFWFLDVEEKTMSDMRKGTSVFLKKLRYLGAKKVGIYIAHHLYKSFNLDLSEADAVWIPHYGTNNGQASSKPAYPCDLHQYTDKGKLDGYGGYLDLNRINSNKKIEFFTGKEVEKNPPSKTESKPIINATKPASQPFNNNSIVDYLNSIGIDSSIANRKKLAPLYGVKNYSGTEAQNLDLLAEVKADKGAKAKAPKVTSNKPATKTLYLPKTSSSWRVYPTNKAPVKGNEVAKLNPKKFGGLTYTILANPQKDVYTIQTANFGKVNIYAAPSTGAAII